MDGILWTLNMSILCTLARRSTWFHTVASLKACKATVWCVVFACVGWFSLIKIHWLVTRPKRDIKHTHGQRCLYLPTLPKVKSLSSSFLTFLRLILATCNHYLSWITVSSMTVFVLKPVVTSCGQCTARIFRSKVVLFLVLSAASRVSTELYCADDTAWAVYYLIKPVSPE